MPASIVEPTTMTKDDKFNLLLGLVAEFDEAGEVTRGTMMGFPCLRHSGKFFACLDRDGDNLIVKLPAALAFASG